MWLLHDHISLIDQTKSTLDQRQAKGSGVEEVICSSSRCKDDLTDRGPLAGHIFLSYSREPNCTKFVTKLKKDLEAKGYSIWLDTLDIHTGSDWHSAIGTALQNCRALVAILTAKYLISQYCKKELFMAEDRQKPILPILLEEVDLSGDDGAGVVYAISSLNRISFVNTSYKEAFSKLVEGLKHHGIRPSTPSAVGDHYLDKPLRKFSVGDVCSFVEGLEIPSKLFKVNSVDGEDLIQLSDEDMQKELKLKTLQIRKIKRNIKSKLDSESLN